MAQGDPDTIPDLEAVRNRATRARARAAKASAAFAGAPPGGEVAPGRVDAQVTRPHGPSDPSRVLVAVAVALAQFSAVAMITLALVAGVGGASFDVDDGVFSKPEANGIALALSLGIIVAAVGTWMIVGGRRHGRLVAALGLAGGLVGAGPMTLTGLPEELELAGLFLVLTTIAGLGIIATTGTMRMVQRRHET